MWIYHLLHQLGCRYIHIYSIIHYIPFYFLQCSFHLEVPQLAPSCPSVDPRSVSVPATKTQQAYVQSIVHQQSRSEQIWQLSEILKRSIWKTMKNLKRSWKTEYFPRSQPNRQPSLACRALIVHLWDMPPGGPEIPRSTQHATGTKKSNKRAHSMHSITAWAQHFSVTQPRPSMRHSLDNQSTQFWGSGLDV